MKIRQSMIIRKKEVKKGRLIVEKKSQKYEQDENAFSEKEFIQRVRMAEEFLKEWQAMKEEYKANKATIIKLGAQIKRVIDLFFIKYMWKSILGLFSRREKVLILVTSIFRLEKTNKNKPCG